MSEREARSYGYVESPWRSTDVHLRSAPYPVEPLDLGGPSEEDLAAEQAEVDRIRASRPPKQRGAALTWVLVILVVVILITVAVVIYIVLTRPKTVVATTAGLGESCATLPCMSGLLCQGGFCKSQLHGPCSSNGTCVTGLVCSGGQCLAGLFQDCSTNEDCAPGLVCGASGQCVTAS